DYIERYDEYESGCEDANHNQSDHRPEWVQCTTSRFLIGPDNTVYPCHRHLYRGDPEYACGSIYDVRMKEFKFNWSWLRGRWQLPCHTKCNPCDFHQVKVESTGRANALWEAERHAAGVSATAHAGASVDVSASATESRGLPAGSRGSQPRSSVQPPSQS
ncbi:MAG: hypothetical protein JSW67_02825, partial [Candidatus Latescibacterota bacterium]